VHADAAGAGGRAEGRKQNKTKQDNKKPHILMQAQRSTQLKAKA
jgi:hypothetical protein